MTDDFPTLDEMENLKQRFYSRLIAETEADLVLWVRSGSDPSHYQAHWNNSALKIDTYYMTINAVRIGQRDAVMVKAIDEYLARKRKAEQDRARDEANRIAAQEIRKVLDLPPAETPVDRIVRELEDIIEAGDRT